MSPQVTEAHRELLHQLLMNVEHGYLKEAAQLIADSEARAVAEIAMAAAASADRNVSLRLERDQLRAELATCKDASDALVESLRAEVERLKPYVSKAVLTHEGTMLCSPLVAVKFNEQTARAERAEAKVSNQAERIRYLEGATNHATGTPLSIAIARAERAEAKLAAERARLDWLMAGGVCMVQHAGGFHVSRLHAPVSRAHIDAAMKEETK